jgi:pSer/pThr/pTyr-binding forkhead associated (FHA) protein
MPAPRQPAVTMPVSQEPPPQAWLVVRQGPRVGAQFGLGMSRPNVIGRDPNKADILIDEDSVSREHARVRFENGQFILYDMASTGGTYVNGNMVQRQMLYDNDKIRLGRVELAFKKV